MLKTPAVAAYAVRRAVMGLPATAPMLIATMGLLIAMGFQPAKALEVREPLAVVELFTSQGCSSCPPADAVLRQFNNGDEILGLALHVDYWDRLGWKDTFGSPENSRRQWQYARSLGERQVYTPQAIVNGRAHFVGSRREDIQAAAEAFDRQGKGLFVPITISETGNAIRVSVRPDPAAADATLYAVYFNRNGEVAIKRGENAGKTIRYSNIVGKMETVGMLGNTGIEMAIALEDMRQKGYDSCAFILQGKQGKGMPGPVFAATVITGL